MKTFKKIILDDLKKQNLHSIVNKIKSIKYHSYSGGDSVNVTTTNLFSSERNTLNDILEEYQEGKFNGMIDLYEYKPGVSKKERQAKYVFLRNEFTDDVYSRAKEILTKQWNIVDDDTARTKMNVWYNQAVNRIIDEMDGL